jgi:L,D-transpeptidase catalytic domain
MILRAAVLLATLLVAGLLGTGVAAASSPAAAPAATAAAVPCRAGVRACVRLSTNQAWLLDGKRVVTGPVPISHGRAGFRTPPGSFRVSFKDQDHLSSVYDDAPMPYSVFFNGDIAFHEGSVRMTSHGCIHLPATAARTFFANLRRGDLVQVVR